MGRHSGYMKGWLQDAGQEGEGASGTLGVLYWRALRVWCMDMISWPHFSVLNAQKSTTWAVGCSA